jgi:hypothetical protein
LLLRDSSVKVLVVALVRQIRVTDVTLSDYAKSFLSSYRPIDRIVDVVSSGHGGVARRSMPRRLNVALYVGVGRNSRAILCTIARLSRRGVPPRGVGGARHGY